MFNVIKRNFTELIVMTLILTFLICANLFFGKIILNKIIPNSSHTKTESCDNQAEVAADIEDRFEPQISCDIGK